MDKQITSFNLKPYAMIECSVLLENSPHPTDREIISEHGLSLFLSYPQGQFIFDFGQTDACLRNSEKLGIDLEKSAFGILSHGHYDHAGGLKKFHKTFPHIPIYAKAEALANNYISLKKTGQSSIDIHGCTDETCRNSIQKIEQDCMEVFPGVHIISSIRIKHELPKANGALLKRIGEDTVPDNFAHELVAVIVNEEELVVLSGCSHNGIVNILETVQSCFPRKKINTVIGGFHLPDMDQPTLSESRQELKKIANQLLAFDNAVFYTGHCTGQGAFSVLSNIMKDRLIALHSGMEFIV